MESKKIREIVDEIGAAMPGFVHEFLRIQVALSEVAKLGQIKPYLEFAMLIHEGHFETNTALRVLESVHEKIRLYEEGNTEPELIEKGN